MPPPPHHFWREARSRFRRAGRGWIDLLLVLGLAGVLFGLADLAGEATAAHHPVAAIDLSLAALPRYTFYSLTRGLAAYGLSLAFALVYGYWAAKDRRAERILIPLLDVFQSIPVLSFMPGLLIAMVALFPGSNVGLELAAVLSIFTGQVWNMVFSLYHSLRSIPVDRLEVAAVFRFSAWQTAKWVELPSAAIGLIWNSMMSMAGGWVFLTVIESFKLRNQDYCLAGLGSYLNEAWKQERYGAMVAGILAMVLMIVGLDRVLWRPVIVWAQKFRAEDDASGPVGTSWVLTALRRSRLVRWLRLLAGKWHPVRRSPWTATRGSATHLCPFRSYASPVALGLLLALLAFGAWRLLWLLADVSGADWVTIAGAGGLTFGRVALAVALGTLWVLPVGLAIGLSPRLAAWLQPVVQVIASIPAPIVYPVLVAGFLAVGVSLGWGSVVLLTMGTQWYILFNVISGAMALPTDLREAARSYRLPLGLRVRSLYLPGVFLYLVTGWVTAAGGAWNLSIVAEYVPLRGERIAQAHGLGAMISQAFDSGPEAFPVLAASTLVLAGIVVIVNRTLWCTLYRVAETRYTLAK